MTNLSARPALAPPRSLIKASAGTIDPCAAFADQQADLPQGLRELAAIKTAGEAWRARSSDA